MITLPAIFSDGMVLAKKAKIWGQTKANHAVMAEFLGKSYEVVSDRTGRFVLTLKAEEFGGPHTLTIGDKTINDIYIGRVWLCGGQSNMEGPISRTRLQFGDYLKDDSRIRAFLVEKGVSFDRPKKDIKGSWQEASGDFLDEMYAVPYFFARNLLSSFDDDVKIGLVCCPAGGTPLEAWLSEGAVRKYSEVYDKLLTVKEPGFVERVTAEAEERVAAWKAHLYKSDIGNFEHWHERDLNDESWDERALLDNNGAPEHGAIWLRRKFTLEAEAFEGGDDFILNFGRFEDAVNVYVNDEFVVNVGYAYPPCLAKIPKGLLTPGENTIVLRVVGEGGKPKAIPGKDYSLIYKGGRVDFTFGKWKWRVGVKMDKCPPGAWFYEYPCGTYNYMLAPLLGLSVEGMIWYQGESNTGHPHNYKSLFTDFVAHIRENFGKNLPVIFTQLANYIDPYSYNLISGYGAPGGYWAILREQQRQCLTIPNTAMAVTIDCGEWNDLHPTDKKTVGDRLALHARRLVYGQNIVSDGPTVEKLEYVKDDDKIIVHFKHGEGLWAKNGHPSLLVLYKDGNVHYVTATVLEGKLTAILSNMTPRAIRFGWADCPSVSIYNAYGLPASPFEEIIKGQLGAGGY